MKTITNTGRTTEKPSDKGFKKRKAAERSEAKEVQQNAEERLGRKMNESIHLYGNYGSDFKHEVRMNSRILKENEFVSMTDSTQLVMLRIYYIADVNGRVQYEWSSLIDPYRFSGDDIETAVEQLEDIDLIKLEFMEDNTIFIQTVIPPENEFFVKREIYWEEVCHVRTDRALNMIHNYGEYSHEKQDGSRKDVIEAYKTHEWYKCVRNSLD